MLDGNRQLLAEALDLQERDDLVVGAFAIELHLRMLIGGAQRLDRRLAGEDVLLLQPVLLAEALGPKLAEPVGQRIQRRAVGHHHAHRLALLVRAVVDRRDHGGGILDQTSPSFSRLSMSAAPASSASISTPHIAALNNPTADITLNRPPTPSGTSSVRYPSAVADLAQRAALGVGRRKDVVLVLLAELLLEQIAEQDELRRRLGGLARLADRR